VLLMLPATARRSPWLAGGRTMFVKAASPLHM